MTGFWLNMAAILADRRRSSALDGKCKGDGAVGSWCDRGFRTTSAALRGWMGWLID